MPGPFPGMDPYLENPLRWPDVHLGLIGSMRAILNTFLPPGYVASMGQRCLEPIEPYLEILNITNNRRVVTAIEMLSPANKEQGSEGRQLYLKKQREILASQTHLIEIDLLRSGQHTVAASVPELEPDIRHDYLVCLHRGGEARRYSVWPTTLRQRLPRIAVPLDSSVSDIALDLQAVFDRNYDEGGYLQQIDYSKIPIPPLHSDDADWAVTLLRNFER